MQRIKNKKVKMNTEIDKLIVKKKKSEQEIKENTKKRKRKG